MNRRVVPGELGNKTSGNTVSLAVFRVLIISCTGIVFFYICMYGGLGEGSRIQGNITKISQLS